MQDHIIVCGAGSTGGYIIAELITARSSVVAIDVDEEKLNELAAQYPADLFSFVVGDATDESVLERASLARARGVVAVLSNDKDNIYIVVESKQVNPKARIIAKSEELGHAEKFRRVGADGVVSPAQIGSLRMVSEMMRPTVVRFLDEMLRDKREYRIEEITVVSGCSLEGVTLREAAIRNRYGMTVLAMTRGSGWTYNPEPSEKLVGGMTIVVLGSAEQVATLRQAVTGR